MKYLTLWPYVAGIVLIGTMFASTFSMKLEANTIYAENRTEVADTIAPVLDRISRCESGGSQWGKDGQVIININTNHTVDIGKYQINSIHGADATKRGFDLYTEKGNEDYARFMYLNLGTSDWYSSQKCWKK